MSDKKILSQSGISLADAYDIEGSIAGVEQLDSEEVKVVHEMGGTMFSERVAGLVRRSTTGAIAQNIAIDDVLNLPNTLVRIYGIQVITDNAARLTRVSVSLRSSPAGVVQEMPLWVWTTNESSRTVDLVDNSVGPSGVQLLLPETSSKQALPIMLIGTNQRQNVGQLAFRGLTSGFGAGTVVVTMIVYHAFAQLEGVSSYGIPAPSW